MKTKWFLAAIALALPSSISAEESDKLWFFIQCQFDAAATKTLAVHLEVAPEAAISTFDPTNLLEGAKFAKVERPEFNDGRTYVAFRTQPAEGKVWTLILQSELPRKFRDGVEVTAGILARSGEESPRETGACLNARTDQAKELFDKAVAEWKAQ